MIKTIITLTIFLSSLLFSGDSLFEVLVKQSTSPYIPAMFKKSDCCKINLDTAPIVHISKEYLPLPKKWKFNSTFTRHLNPMLNKLPDCAYLRHTLDQALGFIGEVYYHTSDSLSIGIKATILNSEYSNNFNQKALLQDMKLNNLFLMATLEI